MGWRNVGNRGLRCDASRTRRRIRLATVYCSLHNPGSLANEAPKDPVAFEDEAPKDPTAPEDDDTQGDATGDDLPELTESPGA